MTTRLCRSSASTRAISRTTVVLPTPGRPRKSTELGTARRGQEWAQGWPRVGSADMPQRPPRSQNAQRPPRQGPGARTVQQVADHVDVAGDGAAHAARQAHDRALAVAHRADAVQRALHACARAGRPQAPQAASAPPLPAKLGLKSESAHALPTHSYPPHRGAWSARRASHPRGCRRQNPRRRPQRPSGPPTRSAARRSRTVSAGLVSAGGQVLQRLSGAPAPAAGTRRRSRPGSAPLAVAPGQ